MAINLTKSAPTERPTSGSVTVTLTQADTFPYEFQVIPNKKRFLIDDIILNGLNKSSTRYILAVLQYRNVNNEWVSLAGAGIYNTGTFSFNHSFSGQLRTVKGNGTIKAFRIILPELNSTSFTVNCTIVGRVE
jgi:hypothetical protein